MPLSELKTAQKAEKESAELQVCLNESYICTADALIACLSYSVVLPVENDGKSL